jgi:hypothetical protein
VKVISLLPVESKEPACYWRFSAGLSFAADAAVHSEETGGSGNVNGARRPFTARLRSAQSALLGQSGIPGFVCPQTLALAARPRSTPASANETPVARNRRRCILTCSARRDQSSCVMTRAVEQRP